MNSSIARTKARHGNALAWRDANQALHRQLLQGLAHGRAADLKTRRQRALIEQSAGWQGTRFNLVLQHRAQLRGAAQAEARGGGLGSRFTRS
jgi:hypothetical protein